METWELKKMRKVKEMQALYDLTRCTSIVRSNWDIWILYGLWWQGPITEDITCCLVSSRKLDLRVEVGLKHRRSEMGYRNPNQGFNHHQTSIPYILETSFHSEDPCYSYVSFILIVDYCYMAQIYQRLFTHCQLNDTWLFLDLVIMNKVATKNPHTNLCVPVCF